MPLKPSQALIRVKSMLPTVYTSEDGNSPYICDNIRELWRLNKIDEATKDMLTAHISHILGGAFCLKDWLIKNKHITQEQWAIDLQDNNGSMLQYTRQNWLNDMMFHFKSKGM